MRNGIVGLCLLAVGGALLAGSFSWSGSKRMSNASVFYEGNVELGRVVAGTVHALRIPFSNPFDESAFLFGVDTSCGCVAAELNVTEIGPGDQAEILVFVEPKIEEGDFSETVRLQSSLAALDQHGVRISGQVSNAMFVLGPADFGRIDPASGARCELSIGVRAESAAVEELVGSQLSVRIARDAGVRHPFQVEPGYWERGGDSQDVLVGRASVDIAPCSLQGRVGGARVVVELPPVLGGGILRLPITGALIPGAIIEPVPVILRRFIESESGGKVAFTIRPRAGSTLKFEKDQGTAMGFDWIVRSGKQPGEYRIWISQGDLPSTDPDGEDDAIRIPIVVDDSADTLLFLLQDEEL